MPDEVHVEFLKMLAELEREGYGRFEHVHLEDGSVLQQIAEVADATVGVAFGFRPGIFLGVECLVVGDDADKLVDRGGAWRHGRSACASDVASRRQQ